MQILALSDIHNNIAHARLVREREDNVYDAVIVAGDIGSQIAEEFFSLLDTFKCPSFCVYGNWDHELNYKTSLSANCTLLHHNVKHINGYYVTGFCGCTAGWGKNPVYLEESENLRSKHSAVLLRVESEKNKIAGQRHQIDLEFYESFLKLTSSAKDRRRKKYKHELAFLNRKKERALRKASRCLDILFKSKEYKSFLKDRAALSKIVFGRNRTTLFETIRNSGIPDNQLIVVTHERLYRIAEEGVRPMLHIYAHVHEFRFNSFKGTAYLNAAAIDNGFSAAFGREELCPEGYCSVLLDDGKVSVVRRLIQQT